MCLGIPGRITAIVEEEGMRMGKVDFGGVSRQVCLVYVPDAQEGQYVIVHAGFAISLLDEHEAQQTLALLRATEVSTPEEEA
jgi:hydrogenase expression/formation protein HypC